MDRRLRAPTRAAALGLALMAGLTACAPADAPAPVPTSTASPTPSPLPTGSGPVQPTGDVAEIATGLTTPWSILRVGDLVLLSSRDTGRILRVGGDGSTTVVGVLDDAHHTPGGEDGLLGLAALRTDRALWIYAYLTTATDNRIVRMAYAGSGSAGGARLGEPEVILAGLRAARVHDGGRIAFGPDGMLYAAVGDAGTPELGQDPAALNGKILRMTPTGGVPDDNPFPGSLVYSLGHRNVQGLAWDDGGTLWASEFGQNTWDELNRIEPGGNYGWPEVEGAAGDPRYLDPVVRWPTSEASPSGLAHVDGTLFLAGLRGERLWAVYPDAVGGTQAEAWFVGEFGRLRDAVPGPDGTLWMLTSETDGRGSPVAGDDRLLEVRLVPRLVPSGEG